MDFNTILIDLRIIIYLRKSEVTVETISVCNVIEKLMEHGIHCLPCSYSNDIRDYDCDTDFKVTSLGCQYIKVLSTAIDYSLVAMVTDLHVISLVIPGEHSIQCMPCSSNYK